MLVRNVSLASLWDAAEEAGGMKLHNLRSVKRASGEEFRFVLRPTDRRWGRQTEHGRRVHAVCFHGHHAFFEALFRRYPDAYVRTDLASYDGVQDFKVQGKRVADALNRRLCLHE